jgi:flagellar basal body-associated protein FliL
MSRGLLVTLVAAVLILAVGVAGLAAYIFLGPGIAEAANTAPRQAAPEIVDGAAVQSFLTLQSFVTDLSDKDRLRYVDVTVVLGLKDEAALAAVKKMEPQVRDTVLSQLRAMVAADLAGASGKDRLAKTLETRLADQLKGHLKAIYITDLIVQ